MARVGWARIYSVVTILCLLTVETTFAELPASTIQQIFHPYATGQLSVPGLTPGTTISKDSWEAAKDYLPPRVLYKEFSHILAPFDLKNSMSVKLRYVRDRYNDDNWLYSPTSRKIRKLIVKQDEASYDSGFLNEDYFGFWGYMRACDWKLLGTRRLLAPVGVKAVSATFGGRGNWYPVSPWELREMLVLEGVPKASGR